MGIDVSSVAWLAMAAVLFLSGLVKGIVGLGMPSVIVGLGSMIVGVKPAMAILIVPSFVTNVWQALDGDQFGRIVKRTWPMMIMIAVGTWLGVLGLASLDPKVISAALGATLIGYSVMGLTRAGLPHPGRWERLVSLPIGAVHGIVAGLTGSYIPGVPFLVSLGLDKKQLIQAMGVLFTFSTLALTVAMIGHALMSTELALLSAAGVIPAVLGMWIGQLVRNRLSEAVFRQALFIALGGLGAYILWRAVT